MLGALCPPRPCLYDPKTDHSEEGKAKRVHAANVTWDRGKTFAVKKAYKTLNDPDERSFFDQPCEYVFGGAMCKRVRPSGDMELLMADPNDRQDC